MHPMKEALTAIGVDVPKGAPDSRWFQSNGLPLMIECEKCGQATALLRAYVDSTGTIYCTDCMESSKQKTPDILKMTSGGGGNKRLRARTGRNRPGNRSRFRLHLRGLTPNT